MPILFRVLSALNRGARQLVTMQRPNKLVRDLLDISLLESQEHIGRQEIILPLLIEKVLAEFDEMLQIHDIFCTVKVGRLKIEADHDKLQRVFINLIDNAIKYNQDKDGKIYIWAEKNENNVIILITNSGQEIPAGEVSKVFTQFYRIEKSRSKKYGGTGLGLTIVKKIIELHGGSVSITSANHETTVSLTLPTV